MVTVMVKLWQLDDPYLKKYISIHPMLVKEMNHDIDTSKDSLTALVSSKHLHSTFLLLNSCRIRVQSRLYHH